MIYKNTGHNKKYYPYFIDIQHDQLRDLNSRLVMPLAEKEQKNSQVRKITPVVDIDDKTYVILSNMLTVIDKRHLREQDAVSDATHLREDIFSAIDMLIAGI